MKFNKSRSIIARKRMSIGLTETQNAKVLMVGPGRNVMGGISTIVNSCYAMGLDHRVDLRYISTMEDGAKLKKLWVAARAYIKFLCYLRHYDIVHIHMAAQASFTRKSFFVRKAYRARKRIIIHSHAADFDDYYFRQIDDHHREMINEVFSLADVVIVLSKGWAEFFGENICDSKKITVLRNAIIPPQYKKEDYSDHNVLFYGRLGRRKGIYDLIEAISRVTQVVPDSMFCFGGDGDIEGCKAIAIKRGVADRIKFLGWVSGDVKEEYFRNCSIFTLPSYHEGMPMSVLEAMSYGLAVLTTNVGGIPDVIENGVNGIVIEPGNVDNLADQLIKLLQDKDQRRRLGQSAADRIVSNFNMEGHINQLIDIYDDLEGSCK